VSGDQQNLGWLNGTQRTLGTAVSQDDFYHGPQGNAEYDVCETWWYEAIVPEKELVASFYLSVRPNLSICSAGSWIWSGKHRTQSSADHLDYRIYLPMPEFSDNRILVPNAGLDIEIVEPLKRSKLRYQAPNGNASAEIEFEGIFDPVMRGNGKHFEQAMRGRGQIRVGGDRYIVDSFSFRDRSWGERRPEQGLAQPPIGWFCGVLDNGRVAFNLSGCDDPDKGAEWAGHYSMTSEQAFYAGWLCCDGEMRKIVSMSKTTKREEKDLMRPLQVEAHFTDDRGEKHVLRGTPATGFRMHFWPNNLGWFGYTEWELDGLKGYGECQDYLWHDYSKRFARGFDGMQV
jgi:hypothetical protein